MKYKYEITQNLETCDQCRFCHKQLEKDFTEDPKYELYCLIKNPGYMNIKLIKVIKARKLGYVKTEIPEWCPLKPVEKEVPSPV